MPSHCRSDRLTQRKGKLPKGRGATMKHGREEEDSLSASSDTTVSSAGSKQQALRFAEDLSLPSVQVVVMSANMGCSHCRQRVANVVSKMNAGLLDYMVDFGKEEVTVRGKVHTKKKKTRSGFAGSWEKKSPSASPCQARTLSWFLGCYGS